MCETTAGEEACILPWKARIFLICRKQQTLRKNHNEKETDPSCNLYSDARTVSASFFAVIIDCYRPLHELQSDRM